jgi:2-polyprenyl-3-methyl-5-hydroxy-6-metoxy-1,4-benzoquinol methylase
LNTDKVWKRYGQVDPYFGVLTTAKYHSWALTEETRGQFFRSGERHVEGVMKTLREINPGFSPARAVDFGCGVGRVALPLARESASVVGVDISPGMLSEAQKNAADRGVSNVIFTREVAGRFDLVHSFMVLQHISPRRGLPIVRDLVSHLDPGGMVVLQIPYDASAWLRLAFRVLQIDPITKRLRNLVKGRALNYPALTMYCYRVRSVLEILHEAGINDIRIGIDSAPGPNFASMTLFGWKRQS